MSKTHDAIMELLVEPVPALPVKRREVKDIPDALVLCLIRTVCYNCHTQYLHPNPHVLGRYERNHKPIKKWSSLFEQLPRERIEVTEKAISCQNCFEGCIIRTGDVEGTKGKVI